MGRKAALLAGLAYGAYPYTILASGWDYPDGAGMSYFLVGMACLTAAARGKRPTLALIAAGIAGMASFYTMVLAAAALPAYLLYYPVAAAVYQGKRPGHQLLRGAALMAIGAALLSVALGLLNRSLGGSFWFYLPSLRFCFNVIGKANEWYDPNMDWRHATWLYAHVFGAGLCLLVLLRWLVRPWLGRPTGVQAVLALNYLMSLGCFVLAELCRRPDLQLPYHTSFIIPNLFLAIGANLIQPSALPRRFFIGFACAFCLVLALPYAAPVANKLRTLPDWILLASAGLVLLPLAIRSLRVSAVGQAVPWISLGFVLLSSGSTQSVFFADDVYGRLARPRVNARCVESGSRYIDRLASGRRVLFWYDDEEREKVGHCGEELNAVYMLGYSIVNHQFPDLHKQHCVIKGGRVVVVVTRRPGARELVARAFTARGIGFRYLGGREIRRGGTWLPLLVFQIENSPK